MPVTIPFIFTGGVGQKAKASEVNACFAVLAAMFTEGAGGIKDADISTSADLNANKLSTTAGKRINALRFEPDAVDKDALKDDATAGSPNAAVNTPDHLKDGIVTTAKLDTTAGAQAVVTAAIRDLAVTKGKLATAPGSRATYAQLEMLVETTSVDFDISITGVGNSANWALQSWLIVNGANWNVRLHAFGLSASLAVAAMATVDVAPTTALPTASRHVWYELKDVVASNSGGTTHVKGRVVFFSLATT